jgi:hypothetical protein
MTVTLDKMNLQEDYLSEWIDQFSTSTVAGFVPDQLTIETRFAVWDASHRRWDSNTAVKYDYVTVQVLSS